MDTVTFRLDGLAVEVSDDPPMTLLEAMRGPCGSTVAKDGCSPQGQCGCCTVLVDGQPRVACVTPLRRVADRDVTSFDGLGDTAIEAWTAALCDAGGSQCGFCTPGIVVRLEWLRERGTLPDEAARDRALAAHLCRCTGWQTIHEAAVQVASGSTRSSAERDLGLADRQARLEGRNDQQVGPFVAAGRGSFAADTAPAGALIAVPAGDGGWVVAETMAEARAAAGKVQGRRSTEENPAPVAVPPGEWAITLQTGWVEPGYLEVDASWCEPGGEPATPLANGGAFGGKVDSPLPAIARELADRHGRAVLAVWSREDSVRHGPKRPPIGAGLRADGSGTIHVARTPGIVDAIAAVAPDLIVEEVDVAGPPTSASIRGAGWVEAAVLRAAALGRDEISSPDGARASATFGPDGLHVHLRAGDPFDRIVLRSYCIGVAHMALGWVASESLTVDSDGVVHDLTIRSFGILRASEMPHVEVTIEPDDRPAVNGSDAVFAAVALAAWRAAGLPPRWPAGLAWLP